MKVRAANTLVVLAAGLAASALSPAAAAPTPRGNGKIAFESTRNSNVDVFVMEADGSLPVRLTTDAAQDRAPAFSPDGSRIAFHSTRSGNSDVFVMNADGTGQLRLTTDTANELQPTWSPDGNRLAYARMNPTTGTHDVFVVRVDGTGAVNVTNHAANDIRPTWSPDGSALVFQSDRDGNTEVYLVPVGPSGATGPAVNLSHHTAEDMDPTWTADGTQVVFVSDRTARRTRLWRMYPDGTLQTQVPSSLDNDKDPSMSPDGVSVVFAGLRGTTTEEIWSMGLDGTGLRRLTTNSFVDRSPDWQGLVLQAPNHPPLADAGADGTVECADADGGLVTLDGSGSTDPDSTPGTNDDLAVFEWFTSFGTSSERLLATGMQAQVVLPPGTTEVTLRVTDVEGEQDTDTAVWTVVDPEPATLGVTMDTAVLWPPDHRLVDVRAAVAAYGGRCSPTPTWVLASVESNESGPGRGRGHHSSQGDVVGADTGTPDVEFQLRAERLGNGSGRVYTITYLITAGRGVGTAASAQVVVPHDGSEFAALPGPGASSRKGAAAPAR